jgi:aryl-alcohol dehydrogenase-like predicted oxidoreductase
MQTRKLGKSGVELTTIGLGTWAIGGGGWAFGWGPQDESESIATIRRALDLGINWIDTAAVYGLGVAEEVVGRAIDGRRDEIFLATKCGLVWDEGSTTPYGRLKAASIRREAEASLRRLRVDVIDLYQIHWPDPEEDIEEGWGEVASLVREGKVRYAGVSNFDVAQIDRVRKIHPVTSLQPPYSMIARRVESELLAYCEMNGIGVIAYSPMGVGLLTGTFTRERFVSLPADDWRRNARQFQEPRLSANLALAEKLRPITARYGRSMAELAIAWVLRRGEVTAAIVGARRPSQIEETVGAADWVLHGDVIAEIDTLLADRERSLED